MPSDDPALREDEDELDEDALDFLTPLDREPMEAGEGTAAKPAEEGGEVQDAADDVPSEEVSETEDAKSNEDPDADDAASSDRRD
jgi:hypothetical protein